MNEIIRDGGVKSRKLWFSIFSIVIIFVGGVLAGHWAGIQSVYGTMVTGILGVVGAYLTGNVAQKLVGVKAMGVAAPEAKPTKPDAKEEAAAPPAPRFTEDE
jgi:uncharacterized membrane protein YeaQ/YmgE (transglycosylase-associated protein family)